MDLFRPALLLIEAKIVDESNKDMHDDVNTLRAGAQVSIMICTTTPFWLIRTKETVKQVVLMQCGSNKRRTKKINEYKPFVGSGSACTLAGIQTLPC